MQPEAAALNAPIGVFGGTFSPIHNGHLRLAIEARERLGLDHVRLLPCAVPPHRTAPGIPVARRLQWATGAVSGEPGLVVDDLETRRAGPSFTVDTLAELRDALPGHPLCLIVGADAFSQLHTWSRWAQLFEIGHVIAARRPDTALSPPPGLDVLAHEATDARALGDRRAGLWIRLEIPALDVSSRRIRALLRAERSIRGLVPDRVLDAITPQEYQALANDPE